MKVPAKMPPFEMLWLELSMVTLLNALGRADVGSSPFQDVQQFYAMVQKPATLPAFLEPPLPNAKE